jgi:hypothetical protein
MKTFFAEPLAVAAAVVAWAGLQSLLLATALLAALNGPPQIPTTQAKTLDGSSVTFPDAASGKPLLFVIGFSHQSGTPCQAWDKRLAPLYLNDPRLLYYEAADFQGVPSLILKMILHGMKRQIPANEHSRFVLLQADEDQWKSVARFTAPNDPYVLLANPAGQIVWQTHGVVTDEQLAALQAAVKTQLAH